ncbi:hypothetical protein LCGC14_2261350, partial [marine sediment metagenome]
MDFNIKIMKKSKAVKFINLGKLLRGFND